MMFHLHEKCKISTRRQIHLLKWLHQVVPKELIWPRIVLWIESKVRHVSFWVLAPHLIFGVQCSQQPICTRSGVGLGNVLYLIRKIWTPVRIVLEGLLCFLILPLWVRLLPGPPFTPSAPFLFLRPKQRENTISKLLKCFHLKKTTNGVYTAIQPQASPSPVTG